VLVARDELAGLFQSFDRYSGKGESGSDASNYLSMFNAAPMIVDRKTGDQKTIYVPRAAVSICGGIQPGILKKVLTPEHQESGMAARFLMSLPPRRPKVWTEKGIDPDIEFRMGALFDHLYSLAHLVDGNGDPQPVNVELSPEAKAILIDYYNSHNVEQNAQTGSLVEAGRVRGPAGVGDPLRSWFPPRLDQRRG
jgi:hypothetical protein